MKNNSDEKVIVQSAAINQWISALILFLAEQKAKMAKNGLDELYQDLFSCFMKNSCAIFSLVLQVGMSYQVVQTMRLLIELVADINFVIKHPENINHLKRKTNKLIKKCEHESDGTRWREFIADAGKISLVIEGKLVGDAGFGTTKRVEEVFGKGFYDFYSSYSHANVFALRDDVQRFVSGDDFVAVQRWELIKDYPLVLEKFIHVMGEAAVDEALAGLDCSAFTKSFSGLFAENNVKDGHHE